RLAPRRGLSMSELRGIEGGEQDSGLGPVHGVAPRPGRPACAMPLMPFQECEAVVRSFSQLDEREILTLAMTLEEEDARIYGDIVEGLETDFPATASVFTAMQAEEIGHRRRLAEQYRGRLGEHVPLISRPGRKGCVPH